MAAGTAAGENIGVPVTATDADTDDTLTYTLGGADATSFGIDAASGQLQTTAASEALAEGSYEVTVTARDGQGGTASVDVTITVGAAGSGVLGDTTGDGFIDRAEVIAAYRAYIQRRYVHQAGDNRNIPAVRPGRCWCVTRRPAGERHRTKRTMFRSL